MKNKNSSPSDHGYVQLLLWFYALEANPTSLRDLISWLLIILPQPHQSSPGYSYFQLLQCKNTSTGGSPPTSLTIVSCIAAFSQTLTNRLPSSYSLNTTTTPLIHTVTYSLTAPSTTIPSTHQSPTLQTITQYLSCPQLRSYQSGPPCTH
ncbi:hypothetical protein Salat_0183800 [Sesamum alatum]|uniref:Uncharacterized protein n=1 Tax=Sesamum alatum TaxID=300844 RepID=A0AAE1YXB4_9LAMI|nr:hypothetical protein Salat_0183800 [Sesamum alatum]